MAEKEDDIDNPENNLVGEGQFLGEDRTIQAKKRMIEALRTSLGIVSPALQNAEVSRGTYYNWIKEGHRIYDPYFKAQVKELNNVVCDFAEHALHKQILAGNTAATIFFLKTQVRHRGYIERPTQVDTQDAPRSYTITPAKQLK